MFEFFGDGTLHTAEELASRFGIDKEQAEAIISFFVEHNLLKPDRSGRYATIASAAKPILEIEGHDRLMIPSLLSTLSKNVTLTRHKEAQRSRVPIMKLNRLQLPTAIIISLIIGIVIGGYLMPSQGPTFGGYPVRSTNPGFTPYTAPISRTPVRTIPAVTGTLYAVTSTMMACQIYLGPAGQQHPDSTTYTLTIDGASSSIPTFTVYPWGFGAGNTFHIGTPNPVIPGYQEVAIYVKPVFQIGQSGTADVYGINGAGIGYGPGQYLPPGDYTTQILGFITGPGIPENTYCPPSTITFHVVCSTSWVTSPAPRCLPSPSRTQ